MPWSCPATSGCVLACRVGIKVYLNGITDWMDVSLSELRELVMDREAWHAAIHGVAKSQMENSMDRGDCWAIVPGAPKESDMT